MIAELNLGRGLHLMTLPQGYPLRRLVAFQLHEILEAHAATALHLQENGQPFASDSDLKVRLLLCI